MWRRFVLLLAVGAASAVIGLAHLSPRVGLADSGLGWSTPQVLVPSTQYAADPQLAVNEDGETLAAWFGGPEPPPRVKAGGAEVRDVAASSSPKGSERAWAGSTVVIDAGTVSGGFGTPAVLAEHGGSNQLYVAISGSGARYVAWDKYHVGWMISSAAPDQPFTAARPLPADALFIGFLASRAGPVAAVWLSYQSPDQTRPTLHYALLAADGSLGRIVTVPGWKYGGEAPLALNDRGEFAAVENTAQEGETPGPPPHPIVYLCGPSGRCMAPHEPRIGHPPAGSEENDAVALNDDGTLTLLTSFSKAPEHPAANTPWGLWASIRHPDGRWSAPQEISNGGERPLAAADGPHSAVTVFQHFWTPKLHWLGDHIEIATRHAPGNHFAAPKPVRGEEAPNPAALATTMNGGLLIAWSNAGGIVGGERTQPGVYAVTGSATHPSAPQLVTGEGISSETPAAGIDREGQGVIVWSAFEQTGGGAGVYASTFGAP